MPSFLSSFPVVFYQWALLAVKSPLIHWYGTRQNWMSQSDIVWCVIGILHCNKLKGHRSVGMGPGRIGCHNQTLFVWCVIGILHCIKLKGHRSVDMGPGRIGCHYQTLSAWCLIGIQHRLYLADTEQHTVNANQILCPIMMNPFIVTASQNGRLRACNVFGLISYGSSTFTFC